MRPYSGTPGNLLYRTQWIFLVVSVIPLAVLAHVCIRYVIPILRFQSQHNLVLSVYITLGLTLVLSVLGYMLSRRTTQSTVQTIEDANLQLSSLLEVGNRLSCTSLMDKAVDEIAQSAMQLIGANVVVVYIAQEERLVCRSVKGIRVRRPDLLTYEFGEGIVGACAESRRPMRIANAATDTRFVDKLAPHMEMNSGSVACYPLVYLDRVLGAIEMVREWGASPFGEEDQRLLEVLGQQAAAAVSNVKHHESQQNYFTHMIELLRVSLENDVVWEGHLHNVARYCNLISRKLGLDEDTRREIHFAAMLHDIGFLKMRAVVGRTDLEGFKEKIKDHPKLGAQLVEPIEIWRHLAPLIHAHHERCDGSGYPDGLMKDQIPLGARILSIAEAFDTMVNPNSYVSRRTRAEALADLETGAGVKYDAVAVKAFLEILHEEDEQASATRPEPVEQRLPH